ncbi:MAG: ABC transporter ATP-binding protein [Candidatus Heimdallarchaeota archaeon]|nr:ABC transporter ATP-binding protein [Candidatus Heimdallarchaeota archaeon]
MFSFLKKKLPDALDVKEDIVISVKGVHKYYTQNAREVHALNDINLDIKRGEFFCIIGRSGSGKTTLLSLLGAMERPSEGLIALNGKTLARLSDKELTQVRRSVVATIYQDYNLIPVLNALQNVELPMLLKGIDKEERLARAEKLLTNVGLEHRMDHKPEELSGGEQQRVAVARALSNRPAIILADEPTGELDPEIRQDILDLIEGVNRDLGTTIVIVTHDMEIADRADRLAVMREGKIIEIKDGKGKDIRAEQEKTREKKPADYY